MRLTFLSAVALISQTASAYLNTSPFFLFSTSSNFEIGQTQQLSSAYYITREVLSSLSSCPSEYYVVVSQPGVSSKDFETRQNTPSLARHLSRQTSKTHVIVNEVSGSFNLASWKKGIKTGCEVESIDIDAATGAIPGLGDARLINVAFPAISSSNRRKDLLNHDAYLASLLEKLPSKDYTVFYLTTPREGRPYKTDSELANLAHQDLKRDLSFHATANTTNQTIIDGPLFDKYQFTTPGIFMGFTVGFVLLLLLWVGVSALASLQVTYAAFDKEQGQLAQRKTQ